MPSLLPIRQSICCGIALLGACAPSASPTHSERPGLALEVAQLISSGDQRAYERYAAANFSPETLKESSPASEASALARIYTDTGGFRDVKPVGESENWVQAEARALITDLLYCLTVSRSRVNGRSLITEVSARDLHPAGPELKPISPRQLGVRLDQLASAYEARNLFSGVILIAHHGKIVLHKAYGSASPRLGVKMSIDTRLNTASIAKMFTGTAIAQLVEQKRLSYDDKVGKFWPNLPNPKIREATIRQLLTHTSGLGPKDYYNDPRFPKMESQISSLADYLTLAVDTPVENPPGTYSYSNSGYLILGAVIERVTGQNFYGHVRERVFVPAGMTNSFYAPGDVVGRGTASSLTNYRELPDHSFDFELGAPKESPAMGGSIGGPQGGAWVTAADLFRFAQALRGGMLLKPETFEQMTEGSGIGGAGASGLTGVTREGLGIEVVSRNGHVFYGHTGGDFGIASLLFWYPQTGFTTILLSNRDARAARVLLNVSRALITRQTIGDAKPPPGHCTAPV